MIDEEINRMGKSWKTVKGLSRNGVRRQNFTRDPLLHIGVTGQKQQPFFFLFLF
jgi:hypothetical protein